MRRLRISVLVSALTCLLGLIPLTIARAQTDSLLSLISDSTQDVEYVSNAFKSTRVINGQSIEMLGAGSLDFRILHRFGAISQGVAQLWGLDQSSVRFGFDWAPLNDLLVGAGRSTVYKEIDGFIKYRIVHQSRGAREMPVSIIGVVGMTCETLPWSDLSHPNYFSSRLAYVYQTIIGSKLSDLISFQLSPTIIHRNLVDSIRTPNDVFALGGSGRIKISNRVAFTFEYFHAFNGMKAGINYDPLSVGVDIETGGHVFQIHLSNAIGMNERAFITDTHYDWAKGQIQLGFNISRVFQL